MDSYNGRASNFETVIKGDLKLLFNPYLFTFVLMNCLFYPVIHSKTMLFTYIKDIT